MAEEDVNYASVVFKANKNPPPPAKKEEETVYDEVKVKNETTEQSPDGNVSAGFLQEKTGNSKQGHYQHLACCLGILCVILLLGIITVGIYITLANHTSEQSDLRANISALQDVNLNLTNANRNLSSEYQKLRWERQNLTVQFNTLNQSYTALESNLTGLTAENQELRTQRDNLTGQIEGWKEQVKETKQQTEEWKKQNVSRVQWSIDQYCPIKNDARKCNSCQDGWLEFQSSCYSVNNAVAALQLTWTEAQANCEGKSSDLVVIFNETDKDYISKNSWRSSGINGYWIGLRVEDGKWKWVDGSDLTESSWIQPASPDEGHCAISVQNQGLKSVNCSDKNAWICQKKAVSLK